MSPLLAQRQIALAGAALLAIVAALALMRPFADEGAAAEAERRSVAARGTGWYTALAAPYALPEGAEETACGHPVTRDLLGVAHPVLPCGAKLVLEHEGRYVLTQVVDRGTGAPGREFDLTARLASRLDVQGVQQIRWRFAAPDEE